MPLLLTVDIHQNALLPVGSQLRIFFNGGDDSAFPLTEPSSRMSQAIKPPDPSGPLTVTASIGSRKPITFTIAGISFDRAALNFNIFPRLPSGKFYIKGNIAHSRTPGKDCNIVCLADGHSAPPGECIDCQDEVAIVELCCC